MIEYVELTYGTHLVLTVDVQGSRSFCLVACQNHSLEIQVLHYHQMLPILCSLSPERKQKQFEYVEIPTSTCIFKFVINDVHHQPMHFVNISLLPHESTFFCDNVNKDV